jgi:hypothetical protein
MRKKLGSFFLGVFVFVGSVGLAAKSLLMNISSDSSTPRRIYASSEDKKLPLQAKDKL